MPPPDAEFPVEEDCADLASIGTLIETNITEIAYIKVRPLSPYRLLDY
jgi:hypothetical protein